MTARELALKHGVAHQIVPLVWSTSTLGAGTVAGSEEPARRSPHGSAKGGRFALGTRREGTIPGRGGSRGQGGGGVSPSS